MFLRPWTSLILPHRRQGSQVLRPLLHPQLNALILLSSILVLVSHSERRLPFCLCTHAFAAMAALAISPAATLGVFGFATAILAVPERICPNLGNRMEHVRYLTYNSINIAQLEFETKRFVQMFHESVCPVTDWLFSSQPTLRDAASRFGVFPFVEIGKDNSLPQKWKCHDCGEDPDLSMNHLTPENSNVAADEEKPALGPDHSTRFHIDLAPPTQDIKPNPMGTDRMNGTHVKTTTLDPFTVNIWAWTCLYVVSHIMAAALETRTSSLRNWGFAREELTLNSGGMMWGMKTWWPFNVISDTGKSGTMSGSQEGGRRAMTMKTAAERSTGTTTTDSEAIRQRASETTSTSPVDCTNSPAVPLGVSLASKTLRWSRSTKGLVHLRPTIATSWL